MSKSYPANVTEVYIFRSPVRGFRYNARGEGGRIVYESGRNFRSRFDASAEIRRRWPSARIIFT